MTGMIRLWTLQPLLVWEQMQFQGSLEVNLALSEVLGDYLHAYEWMRLQMRARLPQYEDSFPWWAYTHKPDLRAQRHALPPGETYVRMQLSMPVVRVLLSSYSEWHWVLGRDVLDDGIDEGGRCVRLEGKDLQHYCCRFRLTSETVRSWEWIFEQVEEKAATDMIQAVFESLDLEHIEAVTTFSTPP